MKYIKTFDIYNLIENIQPIERKEYKDIPYSKSKYQIIQKMRLVSQIMIVIGGIGTAITLMFRLIAKIYDLKVDTIIKPTNRKNKYSDILNMPENLNEKENVIEIIRNVDKQLKKYNIDVFYELAKKIDDDKVITIQLNKMKQALISKQPQKFISITKSIRTYINQNFTSVDKQYLIKMATILPQIFKNT